jgi:YHS domain-containing protein
VAAAQFLLEHMSRTLWDPVDPRRLGSLDKKLHARVNGEIYRFWRTETRDRFRHDPARWCGIVRDPVTGQTFEPSRRSPRFDVADGPYFFVSDSSRAVFRADPGRWEIHRTD